MMSFRNISPRQLAAASILLNILLVGGYLANRFVETGQYKVRAKEDIQRHLSQLEHASNRTVDIVFLGDSITHAGLWGEYFPEFAVANRGVPGNTTYDVLARLGQVAHSDPAKIFLMVGINDLLQGLDPMPNMLLMFDRLDAEFPDTKICVQSILPTGKAYRSRVTPDKIEQVNKFLALETTKRGYEFINLYPEYTTVDGFLDPKYSNDGIHLMGNGYELWVKRIGLAVYNLEKVAGLR